MMEFIANALIVVGVLTLLALAALVFLATLYPGVI
jgi:hypothetical protein